MGLWEEDTSFSVMGETAEVEHAASLFVGLDRYSEQASCMFYNPNYNPVKHGLVRAPRDWEYSSFHRYVRAGVYDEMWGAGQEISFADDVGNE